MCVASDLPQANYMTALASLVATADDFALNM